MAGLDILFLEPRAFLSTGTRTAQDWEPSLGLMCLGAYLDANRPDLAWDVADPTLLGSLDAVREAVAAARPRWIGIPFNLTRTYADSVALARLARETFPEAGIVVGGNHATCATEGLLREVPQVDVVLRHEAEQALVALLDGKAPAEIPGVAFRDAGTVRRVPPGPLPETLDAYPSPYRVADRFQLERRLHAVQANFEDTIFARMVLTSRGCPYDCEFCTNGSAAGRRVRYHGVDFVRDSVSLVRDRYLVHLPYPVVNLTDAIFTASRERTGALAGALSGLGVQFHCQTRVETCGPEVLDALAQMGMSCVSFGIETLNPAILARTGKRFDVPVLKELVAQLHRRSIRAAATFVVGLPGESSDSLLQTARAAARCGFDEAFFFPLVAVRGSAIFERLVREVPEDRREPVGRPENREWLYTAQFGGAELRHLAEACAEVFRQG